MTENRAGDPQWEAMQNKCYFTERFQAINMEPEVEIVVDKTNQVYSKSVPEDCSYESPQFSIPLFLCLSPVVKPWGQYWDLHRSQNTVLKRLVIYSGHRFSYQYHNNRTEFWSVEYGKGLLTLNGVAIPVGPGFSIKIDKYDKHRLANIGDTDLVFYEIQSGECSEEDIVRLSDDYART